MRIIILLIMLFCLPLAYAETFSQIEYEEIEICKDSIYIESRDLTHYYNCYMVTEPIDNIIELDNNLTQEGDYLFEGDVYIHGNLSGASPLSIDSKVELEGFSFEGFNFLRDIFIRIKEVLTNQNNRLGTIEEDLCNAGYNKYC